MRSFTERLIALRQNVAQLVKERDHLATRLTSQENEGREHQRMCEVLRARVSELERENEVLRENARNAQSAKAAPGSKERIDRLVAEIDRCLELLEK